MLIVLDNCEHVITTAAEVAEDLLRHCPALRLIATSREGLRVGGETLWPVPPLETDDAVLLFVTRAQAAGAPLELSDDNRAVIADICAAPRRTPPRHRAGGGAHPGVPDRADRLASERSVPVAHRRITHRAPAPTNAARGGRLELRAALRRRATRIRAIVGVSRRLRLGDGGGGVRRRRDRGGRPRRPFARPRRQVVGDRGAVGDGLRFSQLQTLVQYGKEKLTERGDAVRIRDAMARHYARLCAESAAAFTGDRQRAWLTAVDQEHDNLRAALDWAVANDDAETALTIAGGASWPHWLRGTVIEGKRWLDDAFACAGEANEHTRALGADRPGAHRLPRRHAATLRRGPRSGARDLRTPRRHRGDAAGVLLLRRAARRAGRHG